MKETLVALANRIKLNEANWQKIFTNSIIETAFMLKNNHSFKGSADLKKFLHDEKITLIDLLETEIDGSIRDLVGKKLIERDPFDNSFKMKPEHVSKLEHTTNEWLKLEEQVKNEWLVYLSKKYPSIRDDLLEKLWQNLRDKFVAIVLIRHGAESAQIIFEFDTSDESIVRHSSILEVAIEDLSDELKAIAQAEFPLFFTPISTIRRQYLIGLLNCAFDQFSVAVPEKTLQEIYGKSDFLLNLFLDTNFLFSLLKLHEHHLNESVQEVCSIIKKISTFSNGRLKAKLRYMTDTEDEFRRNVDSNILGFKNIMPAKSIAKAAVQSQKIAGIPLAYLQKIAEAPVPISIEEFLTPYKIGIRQIMKTNGIEIYQNARLEKIKNSQAVIDDIHSQAEYLKSIGQQKPWETVQHDVRIWHYLKELRSDVLNESSFFEKKYYILTCDYRFAAFDRYKHRNELSNMFCLLPPQFLQIISFFIPRTEDFENAFLHSIRMPIAKPVDRETQTTSLNILKTLSVYKDFSESVAVDLLKDGVFRESVKNIEEPEEVRKIVEDTLSKKLDEERLKNQRLLLIQKEKDETLAHKELEHKTLNEEIQIREKKILELQQSLKQLKQPETVTKEEQKPKVKLQILGIKIADWLQAFIISFLTFLVITAYIPWVSLVMAIVVSITTFALYIYVRFRKQLETAIKTIYKFIIFIGVVTSAIAAILEIIDKLSHK